MSLLTQTSQCRTWASQRLRKTDGHFNAQRGRVCDQEEQGRNGGKAIPGGEPGSRLALAGKERVGCFTHISPKPLNCFHPGQYRTLVPRGFLRKIALGGDISLPWRPVARNTAPLSEPSQSLHLRGFLTFRSNARGARADQEARPELSLLGLRAEPALGL